MSLLIKNGRVITAVDDYFADVYELAINGQEISPGYTELNDSDVQAEHFRHLGRDEQDSGALPRQVGDHLVDLDFGGDVDAAGRLVEDVELRALDEEPLGEDDLLLVATRQLARGLLQVAQPDR